MARNIYHHVLVVGDRPVSEEETRRLAAEILKRLKEEAESEELQHPGLRCPKCGCSMAHYRLYGHRCVRGCQ